MSAETHEKVENKETIERKSVEYGRHRKRRHRECATDWESTWLRSHLVVFSEAEHRKLCSENRLSKSTPTSTNYKDNSIPQGQQFSEQQDDSSAANDPQGQEREDA